MKTSHIATALAAAALLALTLAGCAPSADTGATGADSGSDTDTSTESTESTDTGDSTLATLSGSGDYTVGVTAPIGSYQLKDSDVQPDGCTWALQDADGNVQFENQGAFLFITEVNKFFQTSGCPDWVQYE